MKILGQGQVQWARHGHDSLVQRRGVKDLAHRPKLSIPQILAWADTHHERTGRWPSIASVPIADAPDETWAAVNLALHRGLRGLKGGSSLARLLAEQRGVQKAARCRPFRISDILMWADAYHARHGTWPTYTSGPIPESPNDSWSKVHAALRSGLRGLQPGSSLADLLAAHRGVRNHKNSRALRQKEILKWADAFHSHSVGGQPSWPA